MKQLKFRLSPQDNKLIEVEEFTISKDINYTGCDQVFPVIEERDKKNWRLTIRKEAFWDRESYTKGERLVVAYRTPQFEGGVRLIFFVSSYDFFENQFNSDPSLVKSYVKATNSQRKYMLAFLMGDNNKTNYDFHIDDYFHNSAVGLEFFKTVEHTFPSDTRRFIVDALNDSSSDKLHIQRNNICKKIAQISPIYVGRINNEPTKYANKKEIVDIFDKYLLGYEEDKAVLADFILSKIKDDVNNTGMVIGIDSMASDVSGAMVAAIKEIFRLPYIEVDVGQSSSSLAAFGCEGFYDKSGTGSIFNDLYNVKSTQAIINYMNVDEITCDEGRDNKWNQQLGGCVKNKILLDLYIDHGIYLKNTVQIVSGKCRENMPSELVKACDIYISLRPASHEELSKVLGKEFDLYAKNNKFNADMLMMKDEIINEIAIKNRNDFGFVNAKSNLKIALEVMNRHKDNSDLISLLKHFFEGKIDKSDYAVRYHQNYQFYTENQRKEIEKLLYDTSNTKVRKIGKKENFDKITKLDYQLSFVNINDNNEFDIEQYYNELNKEIYLSGGIKQAADKLAIDIYNAKQDMTKPVIGLVGCPGTGKSKLADAICIATHQKLVRIQMNVINDVDSLIGCPSYLSGAKPGILATKLKENGRKDCIVLLDEVEKAPVQVQQALLEILNDSRRLDDAYIGGAVDLSQTQFILTANSLEGIIPPLLNRMSIINIPGYNINEKREIAKLLISQMTKDISFTPGALNLILKYTATDVGIRSMKHDLEEVIKACLFKKRNEKNKKIKQQDVVEILGEIKKIQLLPPSVGCVNGLGVIGSRGMVSPIKCTILNHEHEIRITGMLEEAMRESISVARTYLESMNINSDSFAIDYLPHGIKKDGTSSGLVTVIAILSAYLDIVIPTNIAFTGDFDGYNIRAVGGVLAKVMAAYDAKMKSVLIPYQNKDDVNQSDFPGMQIVPVKTIDDVFTYLKIDVSEKLIKTC